MYGEDFVHSDYTQRMLENTLSYYQTKISWVWYPESLLQAQCFWGSWWSMIPFSRISSSFNPVEPRTVIETNRAAARVCLQPGFVRMLTRHKCSSKKYLSRDRYWVKSRGLSAVNVHPMNTLRVLLKSTKWAMRYLYEHRPFLVADNII